MGHVVGCYPTPSEAKDIIRVMQDAGVDLIEVQIPFSEPMADGPVFMAANQEAIDRGVKIEDCFELMREASQGPSRLLFMSYLNVIYRRGFAKFAEDAVAAGAQGVIVPDLPVEHGSEFEAACELHDFVNVRLLTPNTEEKRLQRLAGMASGLIYAVARTGVTGASTAFGDSLSPFLAKIRAAAPKMPIAVGFGVQTPEDVRFLAGKADYAVIGTQAMRVYQDGGLSSLKKFWSEIVKATK